MKSNTLTLIENYQNYVKSLDDTADCDMLGLDQEVPDSSYCEIKPDIDSMPVEQPMAYNMPNFLSLKANTSDNTYLKANTASDNTYLNSNSLSCSSIPTLLKKDENLSTTMSTSLPSSAFWSTSSSSPSSSSQSSSSPAFQQFPVAHTTSPSPFSTSFTSSPAASSSSSSSSYMFMSSVSTVTSSSPPFTSSSLSSSLPSSTQTMYTDNKSRTFVTELGGSGCTVLLGGASNYMPTLYTELTPGRNQMDSAEYTGIDRLAELSFYDDLISVDQKDPSTDISSLDLDLNTMIYMLENDRKKLNIPQDPHTWSNTEVSRWVKWVCQKDEVPDISSYLCATNGATLCAWDPESFKAQYGRSGASVQLELDLWKASNQLNAIKPTDYDVFSGAPNSFQESSQFFPTPSTSPAPSHDSSQDSRTIFNSSPEHSEDDVFYPEQDKKIDIDKLKNFTNNKVGAFNRPPFKTTTGRGHKKAMTLWQFLLGLLVGPDNNSDCIRWLNQEARIFKIEDSKKVATMWGKVKSRPAMNYDKLSRSVRQYYKKGIIKKPEQTKRLVYQFCPGIC